MAAAERAGRTQTQSVGTVMMPHHFACARVARWTLIAIVTVSLTVLMPDRGSADHLGRSLRAQASFSDVVAFVDRRGWTAHLGRMCAALELEAPGSDCDFRQIALEEEGSDILNSHGFNVAAASSDSPRVLVFHLRQLVGEFFVVSSTGDLIATFLRTRGTDYTRISNDAARASFESELAYWRANLKRIALGLHDREDDVVSEK